MQDGPQTGCYRYRHQLECARGKGREGKIWGTSIAHYGFTVLELWFPIPNRPGRAGADENTTISFSTDANHQRPEVTGRQIRVLYSALPDSCTLIFQQNTAGWGSYFTTKTGM